MWELLNCIHKFALYDSSAAGSAPFRSALFTGTLPVLTAFFSQHFDESVAEPKHWALLDDICKDLKLLLVHQQPQGVEEAEVLDSFAKSLPRQAAQECLSATALQGAAAEALETANKEEAAKALWKPKFKLKKWHLGGHSSPSADARSQFTTFASALDSCPHMRASLKAEEEEMLKLLPNAASLTDPEDPTYKLKKRKRDKVTLANVRTDRISREDLTKRMVQHVLSVIGASHLRKRFERSVLRVAELFYGDLERLKPVSDDDDDDSFTDPAALEAFRAQQTLLLNADAMKMVFAMLQTPRPSRELELAAHRLAVGLLSLPDLARRAQKALLHELKNAAVPAQEPDFFINMYRSITKASERLRAFRLSEQHAHDHEGHHHVAPKVSEADLGVDDALRMLQCMADGHFTPLQNMLRDQRAEGFAQSCTLSALELSYPHVGTQLA